MAVLGRLRLVLTSGLVTNFGAYFTYVAVPLQIMRLTDSPLAVGLVATAVPTKG